MEDLIAAFLSLNPLWVVITVIAGLVTGALTWTIGVDRGTVIALILYDIPFVLIRLLILILFGPVIVTGSGYIGAILFNLYLLTVYLGRKAGRAGKWKSF